MERQPCLSKAQIEQLIRIGDEVAAPLFAARKERYIRYEDMPTAHQEGLRAVTAAIAYAIMDNPAQFTPRILPEEGGDSR